MLLSCLDSEGLHIELIEYDPGFWPNVLLKLELFFKSYIAKVMVGLHVIYFMVAQRYHSKICTILQRKNKNRKKQKNISDKNRKKDIKLY